MPKLFFDIEARFASVQDGLSKIDRDLQKTGASVKNAFAGIGAALSVGLLTNFAESMIASASALDDMAEATGATVEGLSKLTDIARISGKDVGQVETALVRLTRALSGSDEETKGAGAAIQALGLSFDQLKAKSPDQALEAIAEAFARFADGAGKTSSALAIFGRGGAQLLPLLKDISEELDRTGSLTADQAADAEKLEKAWGRMKVEAQNLARAMLTDLIPAFESFATGAARGGIGGAVNAWLSTIGKSTGEAILQTRKQIAEAEASIGAPGSMQGGGIVGAIAGTRLQALYRQLDSLKGMQMADARRAAAAASIDAASGLPSLPFIPSSGGGTKGGGKEAAAQLRASLADVEAVLREQAQGYRSYYDTIDSLRRRDEISEKQSVAALGAAHEAELVDRRKLLVEQAGLVSGHADKYAEYKAKIAEVDGEIIRTHSKFSNDFLEIEARVSESRREAINNALSEMASLQDQLRSAREGTEELGIQAAFSGRMDSARDEAAALSELRAARIDNRAELKLETADTLEAMGAQDDLVAAYRGQAQVLRDTAEELRKAGSLEGLVNQNKTQLGQLKDAIDGWSRDATKAFVDFAFGAEQSIGDMLENIAKQFVAMQIQKKVMDPLFSAVGGLLSSVLPFHSGGIVGSEGGAGRNVSALAFAGAPRFHSGMGPDEYPAILQKGEGVFTPGQMRAMGSGGSVRVEIKNEGTPQRVMSAQPTFDPVGLVVSIVTRDLANNGPITQSMGSTFGVRR